MRLQILGRLALVSDDGRSIVISQPLLRSVICVLVLNADQPLTATQLQNLLCEPDDRQRTGSVKTCIGGARRVLTPARLPPGHGGYRLRLQEHDAVDLLVFRDLVSQAREALGRSDRALAAELYGRGLALWRAPPLEDLPKTPAMSGVTAGLLSERRLAREELVDTALALDRHRELIPGLQAWVAEEPLNERFWAQLMLAIYRSGHKAEALQLYDSAHDTLVQATGTEPGPELQRLWHRIKVDDPDLNPEDYASASRPSPSKESARPLARQLPPDVGDFTGRTPERDELCSLLASAATAPAPPIVQISGAPGVGKTSLAVHVAHTVAESFPDGQLYLQLAGASPSPRDPAIVLNEVLRAIGIAPADIPDTLAERAALYRSQLAVKRVLIVADDAAEAHQVQPLLPGTTGSAIVITSRRQSLGLDGAHLLGLERLSHEEGLHMLARIIGHARVAAEPHAADRIVRACDGFPLAVRIAGARLACRPAWPLAHMAGLLIGQGQRLDQLATGNTAVRAHIEASYDALDERSQRAFRLLALAGPHDVAPWVVGVLLGETAPENVVEGLVDKCLLTSTGVDATGQPRYRLHDLLREYAAERAAEDPASEPAWERLTIAWLELVDHANAKIPRDPYLPPPARFEPQSIVSDDLVSQLIRPAAATWFGVELQNLRRVVENECAAGRFRLAMGIVLRMASYLHLHHRHDDAEHLWKTVSDAAERGNDPQVAAQARLRAAMVIAADRGRPADAYPFADTCVTAFERFDSQWDLARALSLRAYCAQLLGNLSEAQADAEQGLQIARHVSDQHAEFSCLRILGLVFSQQGEHETAAQTSQEALNVAQALAEPAYAGIALYTVVRAHLKAENYEPLPDLCAEGLHLTESINHVLGTAYFNEQWGYAHQGLGQHAQAIARLERAAELFATQEALAAGANCRMQLADTYRAVGRYEDACTHLEWCIAAFSELGRPDDEQRARAALTECRHAHGNS